MAVQQVPDEEDLARMAAIGGGKRKELIFELLEKKVTEIGGMWH